MADFVVTSAGDEDNANDGVLTLREAIAASGLTPESDTITFDETVTSVSLGGPIEIAAGQDITINGDIDDDGLSDVLMGLSIGGHFTIRAGADVTIIGIVFTNGIRSGATGDAGTSGANGANAGPNPQDLADFYTFVEQRDHFGDPGTDGEPGADGSNGTNGGDGENAGGSIVNDGNLTLIRSSFGNNIANGAFGGVAGSGGHGGTASGGGEGLRGSVAVAGNAALPTEIVVSGNYVIDGGKGGTGGNGGNGGDAGGAIFNDFNGTITLVDVAFGGAMVDGVTVLGGNSAIQLADGRLLYVFYTWNGTDGDVSENSIAARLATANADGSLTFTDEFRVNEHTADSQDAPQVMQLAGGRILFLFRAQDPTDGDNSVGGLAARIGTANADGILVIIPLFLPTCRELGIDLVHFGVVAVVNCMIGLITPPYGILLFVINAVTGIPLAEIIREIWLFLAVLLVALAVLILWPGLVLWLPRLFGYLG